MTVISLFTGIGGFELGLEPLGFKTILQVENDPNCIKLLERRWPQVRRIEDVRQVENEAADVVCGGDPCPSRSLARGDRQSTHPDLSGYFLAVVGRSDPMFVLRENVCSSDVVHFTAGLEALGYGVVAFALDARDFTGQSRRRQFCLGCPTTLRSQVEKAVLDAADGIGFSSSRSSEETPIAACITAYPMRLAAEDSYCYEPGRGLRFLDPREVEALQGFPRGYTTGFALGVRRAMLGRAVPPPMIRWIGERILEVVKKGGED